MKKGILIFCTLLITFSLVSFGLMSQSNTRIDQEGTAISKSSVFDNNFRKIFNKKADLDLVYNVDSRFNTTITKEQLNNATSIFDIFPKEATESRTSYKNIRISILHDDNDITEVGQSELLNSAQLNLLKTTEYSNNIRITSICKRKNTETGEFEDDSLVYYMTIIPENEVAFTSGYDKLIEYLKENSKDDTAIIRKDKLQPGKVSFTVTKEGKIANVKLSYTSGYSSVDEALIELVEAIPETWQPATNSKGEKVDQELIFFFGLQGC